MVQIILANLVLILSFVTSCFAGGETHVHLSKFTKNPGCIGGTYDKFGIYCPAYHGHTEEKVVVSMDFSCSNIPESMINQVEKFHLSGNTAGVALLIWKDR